jgi:hypothetical protein
MKTWTEKITMFVVFALLAGLIGCMALQNAICPAWIDEQAKVYVADSNGQLPFPIPRFWWTSIYDAELMDKLLTFKHEQRQVLLDRAKEDDRSWVSLLKGRSEEHLANARVLRTELFTTQGTIGAILVAGLSMYAGKLGFSKPSDVKEIERLKNNNAVKPIV